MHIGKLKSLLEAIELMEYKREITASKMRKEILTGLQKDTFFSDQVTDKDENAKVDAVLSKLEEMDPTNNKQFVPWLAKNYGLFRIEDSGRVAGALSKFVKLKTQISRQGKSVDIGQYDWNSFEAMIDDITKVDVGTASNQSLNYENIDDIQVLYSGAYGRLMIPTTEAASCEIGSGTKWCTSARKDNRFDEYNAEGKLYVWIDKSGDKYQFHFEKGEYKDSLNRNIPDDKIKYFVNEHPVLRKFFSKMAPKHPVFAVMYLNNPDKDVQMAAVNQDGYVIRFIKNPDTDVQLAAVNQNGAATKYINNPDKDVQLAAVKENGYAIKFIENPDKDVQLAAVKQDGYVIRFIKNPDKDVQIAAIKNKGYDAFTKNIFSPEVIQWAEENGYI